MLSIAQRLFATSPTRLRMHPGALAPPANSRKPRRRWGRGIASSGRTCGRGHSGQNSRSGGRKRIPGFTGGQTRTFIRLPKIGKPTGVVKKRFVLLRLDRLQRLIDTGRVDAKQPITIKSLWDAGIRGIGDGIRVTGLGGERFASRIIVLASQFSSGALRIIEGLGGVAIAVYHDGKALQALTRPHFFTERERGRVMPRFGPPARKRDILYYTDEAKRGYLAPRIMQIFKALPGNSWRYIFRRDAVVENDPPAIPYLSE